MKKIVFFIFLFFFQNRISELEEFKKMLEEVFTDALEQAYKNVEEKIQNGQFDQLQIPEEKKTQSFNDSQLEDIAQKVADILKEKNQFFKSQQVETSAEDYHNKVLHPEEVVYENYDKPLRIKKQEKIKKDSESKQTLNTPFNDDVQNQQKLQEIINELSKIENLENNFGNLKQMKSNDNRELFNMSQDDDELIM